MYIYLCVFGRKETKFCGKFVVFVVLWCLWLERNARVFNQQFLPPYLLRGSFFFGLHHWCLQMDFIRGCHLWVFKGTGSMAFTLMSPPLWEDSQFSAFGSICTFLLITKYIFYHKKNCMCACFHSLKLNFKFFSFTPFEGLNRLFST